MLEEIKDLAQYLSLDELKELRKIIREKIANKEKAIELAKSLNLYKS